MNNKSIFSSSNTRAVSGIALSSVLALTASFSITTAQAEILSIGKNAKVLKKTNMPKHGDSMKTVSRKFGSAKKVKQSKGKVTKSNPKITQWMYPGFSVYFENSHVIHSVIKR